MGAAIVNDDGAIRTIPLEAPARNETPVKSMMISMTVVKLIIIPMVVTLVGIVKDVIPEHR